MLFVQAFESSLLHHTPFIKGINPLAHVQHSFISPTNSHTYQNTIGDSDAINQFLKLNHAN